MIFTVINQKGGAGKTTLAVHLALYLLDQGNRVAFIDNDPQQSARAWLSGAQPDMPIHSPDSAAVLVDQVNTLTGAYDVVVCDGAPRLNDHTRVLMYMADRILVPVLPSTVDLRATLQTKEAIDQVQAARQTDGLPEAWIRLIMNKTRASTQQTKLFQQVLRSMNIPLAQTPLTLREAYSQCVTNDTVVTRVRSNKAAIQAADEITALFEEVVPESLRHTQAKAA
jgi:chromosome partitioning protein